MTEMCCHILIIVNIHFLLMLATCDFSKEQRYSDEKDENISVMMG